MKESLICQQWATNVFIFGIVVAYVTVLNLILFLQINRSCANHDDKNQNNKSINRLIDSIYSRSMTWMALPPELVPQALHLKDCESCRILACGIPTHTGWKREWQELHSSSGMPVTPGQNGLHGVKFDILCPLSLDCSCLCLGEGLVSPGGGRTCDCRPCGDGRFCADRFIGRILTPAGSVGSCRLDNGPGRCPVGEGLLLGAGRLWPGDGRLLGGRFFPTGGCILLSITVYFCSLLAEKERVVPIFTLSATWRGTLRRTALPP